MPCRDYMDDHPEVYYGQQAKEHEAEIKRLQKKLSFAESSLCAVMRAAESGASKYTANLIDVVNFKDAGIDRKSLEAWFENHKKVDAGVRAEVAKRKKAAAEFKALQAEEKRKRLSAIAKLTPEEIVLLGVKR